MTTRNLMQVEFSQFNPMRQLPHAGILQFVGTTGAGKTTLMFDILYFYKDRLDFMMAFVGSAETAEELRRHIPDIYVFEEYKADLLENLLKDQEMNFKIYGKKRLPRVGIFMDDMSFEKQSIFGTKLIRRIAYNCRHCNLLFMCSSQYCKDVSPDLRDNTKVAFLCANNKPRMRKFIYEAYDPGFEHFLDFDKTFKALTQNFEVMVCVNSMQYDLSQTVFFYKANPDRGEWKVNAQGKWWKEHKKHYDKEYYLNQLKPVEKQQIIAERVKQAKAQRQLNLLQKHIPGSLIVKKRYIQPEGSQFYHYRRNR